MTKKIFKEAWTEEVDKAFNDIKNCLISAPILLCPDFFRPFTLQTDASAVGIGGVLTREFADGEHVVAYTSRTLTKQERNFFQPSWSVSRDLENRKISSLFRWTSL